MFITWQSTATYDISFLLAAPFVFKVIHPIRDDFQDITISVLTMLCTRYSEMMLTSYARTYSNTTTLPVLIYGTIWYIVSHNMVNKLSRINYIDNKKKHLDHVVSMLYLRLSKVLLLFNHFMTTVGKCLNLIKRLISCSNCIRNNFKKIGLIMEILCLFK
jgi:hypothetical protein